MPRPLHVTNARIWTGLASAPWVRSVTIADGRIAAIDTDPPASARVVDAGGCVAVPGLIDAHVHLLLAGLGAGELDLSGIESREAFEAAIAERHRALSPERWLVAHGWSEQNWPGAAMPDRSWLAAAGDRPVVCRRMDIHAALVNDAVLAQCDHASRPDDDPAWGGRIERDATGAPTGLMVEAAAWQLVNPLIPCASVEERRAALLEAQRIAHACGLTAVGTMEHEHDVESVFVPMREALTLRCQVTLLDRAWPMAFDYGRDFAGDETLGIIGYKTFLDGTFGSRSARMHADYADDPGNRGLWLELAAAGDVEPWARAVRAAGLSPSIHAIGDAAVRLALDVVTADDGPGPPARIEHAQHVTPADVPRFAGVIASMQPLHKAVDGRAALARLGVERLAGSFAFRSLLDAGAHLAFGSDWPVVSCDPLAGVRAAVTGLTTDGATFLPEENLTVDEALTAYTVRAAEALQLDAGVIAPGRLGDLVILDADPFTADWASTPPRVRRTIVGGEIVFDALAGR